MVFRCKDEGLDKMMFYLFKYLFLSPVEWKATVATIHLVPLTVI